MFGTDNLKTPHLKSKNDGFEIIFEDDCIIVINKVAKLLVQPSPRNEKVTLTSLLEEKQKQKIFPCHRLDRETTGLLIYAKTSRIQQAIMNQFRKGRVKKKYIALVKDKLKRKKGLLENYIVDREGKLHGEKRELAKTAYRVLRQFNNFSLLELKPLTGRTNQLRIQLAKIGNPILGERKYAFGRDFKVKFKRLALHAFYLSFIHPLSLKRVSLEIDLPRESRR